VSTDVQVTDGAAGRPITVAVAADDLFAMPLAATARSVVDTLTSDRPVEIVVLDGGIRPANRRRIERSLHDPRVTLRFERPRSARLEAAARKATNLAPLASYARLLLPELLADRDRVTYLDSDTIVRTDIGALHDLDMDGHACLGVPDIQGEGRMGKVTHLDWQSEDVDPDAPYVNTGVLLIDLHAWRSLDVTERGIGVVERHRDELVYADQDVINLILSREMGPLDPRWNVHTRVHTYASEGVQMYDDETLERTLADPWVIHYTNNPKPWRRGCTHPHQADFFAHLDRTEWRGWRPTVRNDAVPTARRLVRRAGREINRRRPR
jgi:lipopolysaccharide biosynthesis glycosyltransferase